MNVGSRTLTATDVRDITSTKQDQLGAIGVTEDGRVYRYGSAGASNLAAGKLAVNADLDTNVTNVAVAVAAAIGATSVSVTAGNTIVADAYADGYLVVNDATGEGILYRVVGNSGRTGAGTITVSLAEPIQVALTTSSEVTLKVNPWANLVISATDQADQAMGVPNVAVTAAYFGWFQTRGECAVLADEAVNRGLALTIGTGTAGAVEALDAAGEPQIGVASEALVDTEYRSAFLTID